MQVLCRIAWGSLPGTGTVLHDCTVHVPVPGTGTSWYVHQDNTDTSWCTKQDAGINVSG